MPPRLRLPSGRLQTLRHNIPGQHEASILARQASTATATTPAATPEQMTHSPPPIARYPHNQPPSHRKPEFRKSQLLRQYTSLLRSTPLIVFFQHNNLQSTEWVAVRRELATALRKLDEQLAAEGKTVPPLASQIKVQIVKTSLLEVAMRIVEYFRPKARSVDAAPQATDPATQTSAEISNTLGNAEDANLTHDLSRAAHDAVMHMKGKHEMSPLLVGPVAVLSVPVVSPEHLKTALSILCPKDVGLPTPKRKANPGWHDPAVQGGVQKLNLMAARVEGRLFDVGQTKWVTSIEGGMDGLRAQLVRTLQSVGANVTNTLEGAGKSLYFTLESRRSVMEEEQKGPEEKKDGE